MAATREIIIYLVYPNDHKIEIYSWGTKHKEMSMASIWSIGLEIDVFVSLIHQAVGWMHSFLLFISDMVEVAADTSNLRI